LDVGGESTRPDATAVSAAEEITRVAPVIERLIQAVDLPLSIDTYKAEVAQAALDAGASLVNDVWALRRDPELGSLVAERGVPVILMHNRLQPRTKGQAVTLQDEPMGAEYTDLMADLIRELRGYIARALDAGVTREQIIVDPGIGFGKTTAQHLEILRRLDELRVLGRPILLGTSRKPVTGYASDLPPTERNQGTAATVALGIARGADIVRVHDVQAMARVARLTDAIARDNLVPD
jgi:dihydropteroate synthase